MRSGPWKRVPSVIPAMLYESGLLHGEGHHHSRVVFDARRRMKDHRYFLAVVRSEQMLRELKSPVTIWARVE
jgi:hypothetical protein